MSNVLERLAEYRLAVFGLSPALPRDLEELVSLKDGDALAIWALLDMLGEGIEVVEVGTFVGASAFVFASRPNVSHFTGIDPNPALVEVEVAGVHEGLPEDISVLEVARSALSCFGEGEKVELLAGTTETVTVPRCDLAFIDGAHTRGWVRRDLAAILQRNQRPSRCCTTAPCPRTGRRSVRVSWTSSQPRQGDASGALAGPQTKSRARLETRMRAPLEQTP